MKKLLFLLAIALLLSACSNIPDKPVTEELTSEEIAEAVKSDSCFAEVYDFARFRTSLMRSADIAKYSQLSYRDAVEYTHFLQDSAHWQEQKPEYEKEWEKQNEAYLDKVDSVINDVRKQIKDSKLHDYVDIRPIAVSQKPISFVMADRARKMSIEFEIEPINGPIRDLVFSYGFLNDKRNEYFDFAATEYIKGEVAETMAFNGRSVTIYKTEIPDIEELTGELGLYILPQYLVNEDNDTISFETQGLSMQVLRCACLNKSKYEKAYEKHRNYAFKEMFPLEAVGKDRFVREKIKEEKKQKDPLSYEFFMINLE